MDIISDPPGVKIYINGKYFGTTPLTGIEVPTGKITIMGSKDGYGTATKRILIKPDEVVSIKMPMKSTTGVVKKPEIEQHDVGSLLVINKIGNVLVYIDGQKKGQGSLSIVNISTGTHELRCGSFSKKITIYKDYKLKVNISKSGVLVLNDIEDQKRMQIEKAKYAEKKKKELKPIIENTLTNTDKSGYRSHHRRIATLDGCNLLYEVRYVNIRQGVYYCSITTYPLKDVGKAWIKNSGCGNDLCFYIESKNTSGEYSEITYSQKVKKNPDSSRLIWGSRPKGSRSISHKNSTKRWLFNISRDKHHSDFAKNFLEYARNCK
jgi:hypothetical protein